MSNAHTLTAALPNGTTDTFTSRRLYTHSVIVTGVEGPGRYSDHSSAAAAARSLRAARADYPEGSAIIVEVTAEAPSDVEAPTSDVERVARFLDLM